MNPKTTHAKVWAEKALDLFFPTICAGCGTLGEMICAHCVLKLIRPQPPWCQRCGRSLSNPLPVCDRCQAINSLHQVRATFFYQEPLTEIIKKFKYDSLFAIGSLLGEFMVRDWPQWDKNPDIVIPIPLHARRLRMRGFNQSAILASSLETFINVQVDQESLRRTRYTQPQVGLNPPQRKENVADAFAVTANVIKGKNILLVDDLFTTGATMSSAADALIASGAASVSAYCLARTIQ